MEAVPPRVRLYPQSRPHGKLQGREAGQEGCLEYRSVRTWGVTGTQVLQVLEGDLGLLP